MNKEEIEHIEKIKTMLSFTTEGTSLRINNEVSKLLLKYIQHLEQKSETLDKVTDYAKMYIDDKQNEYEAISESYICQTDEDEYIKEKELAIIKGQKQVLKNVLNIIEGEK